jgi:hypothetical protein
MDFVVLPKPFGRRFVFKIVEQWSGVQKGDGRDA